MTELVALTFKEEALDILALPAKEYFLPIQILKAGLDDIGKIPKELLLHGLQLKMAEKSTNYKEQHQAILAICNLFDEPGIEDEIFAEGENWTVLYGDIDLASDEIVTIQRKDELLAALKQEGEHLVINVYQPLDDSALGTIRAICANIDKMTGEAIGRNKLRYAAHRSNSISQAYSSKDGNSYLSYWQHGLGISNNGDIIAPWKQQASLKPLPQKHIGTQLYINEFFNQHEFCFDKYFSALNTTAPAHQSIDEESEWHRIQFLGCLLGGAIGDAFGAPVEFMKRDEIIKKYGNEGIQDFDKAYGKIGAITDDTQMTLFTAEGLLRSWVRGCFKGITSELGCIGHAYQRWYQTQGYSSPRSLYVETDGYLWQQRELHSQRAPGNTCLSALAVMESFETPAINNSKGCGGVMRVAPVGLYCWRLKNKKTVEDCFDLASNAANLTHGHATGYLASGAFAAIIYQILEGDSLIDACKTSIEILYKKEFHTETIMKIESAIRLSKDPMLPHEAINYLGEGWIAEEALAISIYCALKAKSFKELMCMSVSHDGDSDSTGAIAGNIWGTLYGMMDWPETWADEVEIEYPITEIACDLYNFPLWEIGLYSSKNDLNELIKNRYPGN
ncbi:ADP-ribosylglycohydrolase family protein [Colwelliaceae bacterium BS250]